MFFLIIFIATVITQTINLISVKHFNINPTFNNAILISILCIPIALLSNACYIYYYGVGYKIYSFPMLSIFAYGVGLLVSVFIQFIILKNKTFILVDYISIFLVFSGIILFVFRNYFK